MKWSHIFLFVLAVAASTGRYVWSPFPPGSENPVVALMALDAPMLLWVMHGWYAAMPGTVVFIGGTLVLGVWRVWFESGPRKKRGKGELPPWPISPSDEKPAIVVGETHHPVEPREVPNPDWLVIPERGLYTGVAIFGAVGSGKTSACMHPFARQLFGWQARNPQRRAAGLVLEVKGDFCYDIRGILGKAGREDDYMELSLDGKWQWNPLAAHWLDAYSLAYTVSSLLNQLFGKGKDPFWQQAYTNLVKWIIELYRIFPDRWVTLRDVYHCAINPDLFKEKIDEAGVVVYVQLHGEVVISDKDWKAHKDALLAFGSWNELEDGECKASKTPALKEWLQTEGIPYRVTVPKSHTKPERLLARWQSVKTWYDHDWMKLDPKLRTSCVEGISSFLSLFDMEDVADIFCPQAPPVRGRGREAAVGADRIRRNLEASSTPGRADRERESPRPQHARRLESGAGPRRRRVPQKRLAPDPAPAAGTDESGHEALLPARRFHLRRVPVLRLSWRGRPLGRREGVCPHPAMPRHPHRRHPVHILAPIRPGNFRGLARSLADAPHPDLPLPQRRRKRRARLETLRPGGPNQTELDRHRIRTTGPGIPALWKGRWNQGLSGHE